MALVVGEKWCSVIFNDGPNSLRFVQVEKAFQKRDPQIMLLCEITQHSNFRATL